VVSSANFRTGGDYNDFWHGWLNYQIEHHVWPNLSALSYQRGQAEVARAHGFCGLVMEGRDIGSVVLPQAEVRVFLQADPLARAQRRAAEGQTDAVAQRDLLDSTRATAPLVCPEGATRIDNTHLPLVEVVAQVKALIQSVARPA
jgi:cytidylate kinase